MGLRLLEVANWTFLRSLSKVLNVSLLIVVKICQCFFRLLCSYDEIFVSYMVILNDNLLLQNKIQSSLLGSSSANCLVIILTCSNAIYKYFLKDFNQVINLKSSVQIDSYQD